MAPSSRSTASTPSCRRGPRAARPPSTSGRSTGPSRSGGWGSPATGRWTSSTTAGRCRRSTPTPSEDLDWWSRELGREIPHGFFGENLTTAGIDIGGARQGEQWRLGEADDPDHVVLQVTDSRIPCSTFQWRMREPRWVRRFAEHGEPGAYLSVVKEGVVRAGAVLEVVQVPEAAKTIREQFAEVMGRA